MYEALGYQATITPATRDYGADLILEREDYRWVVQAKCQAKPVGNKAVQEVAAARSYYKADYSMVVANRDFTPGALDQARASAVELVNRDRLLELLLASGVTK
jgi:restriction system protein